MSSDQDRHAPLRTASTGAVLAAVAVLVLARALAFGAGAGALALHAGFVLGWILAPGWCVVRAVRTSEGDLVRDLAESAFVGWLLLGAAFLGLQAFDVGSAIAAWPAVAVAAVVVVRTKRRALLPRGDAGLARGPLLALAALALLVALRTLGEAPSEWWYRSAVDSTFHAGNVAALAREFPFENPRLAGAPFAYHVFAYAPIAAERVVLGIPVEELYFRVGVQFLPLLFLLVVFDAARALAGSAWAGVIAAALLVLHLDVGRVLAQWRGPELAWTMLRSDFDFGVYTSPSTCAGLAAAAALVRPLLAWFATGSRGALLWAAVVAACASATKGSVAPVVIAGLGAAWLVLVFARRPARRAFVATLVLALAALPVTLVLATGEESYAGSMFRVFPWATVRTLPAFSGLAHAVGSTVESASPALVWGAGCAWIVPYLGLGGVLGAAGVWVRRRTLGEVELALALGAVAGLVPAIGLAAPGESHLFFAYTGLVGLALLAGRACVERVLPRGFAIVCGVVLGAPLVFALVLDLGRRVYEMGMTLPAEPPRLAQHRASLAWMREHLPRDAVLVVARREMQYSVFTERACFAESELYTPRWAAAGWSAPGRAWSSPTASVYPRRAALTDQALAAPSDEVLRAIAAVVGAERRPLFVVHDRLRREGLGTSTPYDVADPRVAFPPLPPSFRVVHESETVRVAEWSGR